MVAMRTLVNGKVSEIIFKDGDDVRSGDVIARLEVSVTEEEIAQLEDTVALAKDNYEQLKLGQVVKVPVKHVRTIAPPPSAPRIGSASLASLEERANRMAELFEMGAVSARQRDAARQAYESALAESYSMPEPSAAPIIIEEIEYVDQWQPTPPAALQNAENAIAQAELSLNVAIQESRKTEIIAPVSGTIFYTVGRNGDLDAGDTVAKIGDSNDLWIAAEVSEETFNKIPLGKVVNYVIEGKNLSGTVIEKIAPYAPEELPAEEHNDANTSLAEIIAGYNATLEPVEEELPVETPDEIPAQIEIQREKTSLDEIIASYNLPADILDEPPPPTGKIPTEELQPNDPVNEKYILRFSLPTERNFECKPNTSTTVNVHI